MADTFDSDTGEITEQQHRRSDPCGELFGELAKAQALLENVGKDGKNPHFGSRYATLGAVLDEIRPKFGAAGLSITQMPVNGPGTTIGVVTLIGHGSGQWIESTFYVAPAKFDAQSAGSVITYLRRYALMAMAGLGPEDDDGNAAAATVVQPAQRQVRPPPSTVPPKGSSRVEAELAYRRIRAAIASCTTIEGLNSFGAMGDDAGMELIKEISPVGYQKIINEDNAKRMQLAEAAPMHPGEMG